MTVLRKGQTMTFDEWKAEVVKQLALRKWTRRELAESTGYKTSYIAGVVSGTVVSRPAIKAVSDELGIEPYVE